MTSNDQTALLERLRALDCCTVSDAMDRLDMRRIVTGVPCSSGGRRIAGIACTVKLGIGNPAEGRPRHLCAGAIEQSGPNNIIVIEQRSGVDAGSWGGLLTLAATGRGIEGVVVDGPVRDIDEARALGFPVYTRTHTARTARGRIVELETNAVISFEGVRVEPGDFVLADSSGVAFIAASDIEALLETAESIALQESRMAEALRRGVSVSSVMGGDYEKMLEPSQ